MRIEKLDIEGFRSLRKVSWQPGVLNILIGPNGSGKSNLLHMLELISASAQGKLGDLVQKWGGMDPLVWDGQAKSIKYSIDMVTLTDDDGKTISDNVYSVEMERLGHTSAYNIGAENMCMNIHTKDGKIETKELIERKKKFGRYSFTDNVRGEVYGEEKLPEEETLLSQLKLDRLVSMNTFFQDEISSWKIYHDVRVDKEATIRRAAVTRASKVVDNDGQNLIHILHTLCSSDRKFEEDINSAMRAAFGDDFDKLVFPPDADQRIQMRLRWKSLKREISTLAISDGTLRFLFLLAVLANPNPPSLIAIDEPENGLHPSMLLMIAEFAAEAATRTQVIISTHSAQLLDAFTSFRPTTTVVKCEEGETTLKQLDGEALEYWLKEYSLGTLYASGQLEGME